MSNGSLMKVKSIAECSLKRAFCNTFDLHLAIIGLENQFLVFMRVVVLDRFFCTGITSRDSLTTKCESSSLCIKFESLKVNFPCLNKK